MTPIEKALKHFLDEHGSVVPAWHRRELEQALHSSMKEDEELRKQMLELMKESEGVAGLHLNGDVAEWDWLISNGWLSALAPTTTGDKEKVKG